MPYLLTLLFILISPPAGAVAATAPAPGYSSLPYTLPAVGSYALPPFMRAADGEVLDENGQRQRLHQVLGERYALLSFMYSSCSDTNGCPLSAFVLYQLKTAMAKDPQLAANLRLVSLSFDPQRDTPATMKLYANNFRHAGQAGDWRFVTTASEQQLQPLLRDYAQDVQRDMSVGGSASQDYSHVLRVFLIDPQKRVRNSYSVSFLHADLIRTDLQTLLREEPLHATATSQPPPAYRRLGPGDEKSGYESERYETRSRALQNRRGEAADLVELTRQPPLGLPALPQTQSTALGAELIALGRKLFYDRRLSLNDTFSCAMCHIPEQGFSSNEMATAVGIEGRSVRRNTPTLLNVGFAGRLFHDGREDSLAQQVWGPLLARNEMGNPSVGHVLNKIKRLPDYQGLFEGVFAGQTVSMQNLGDALAAYQRSLNAADADFDRWFFGKQAAAVSDEVKTGFELFRGKAGCSACHRIEQEFALFSDDELHNTGVGYRASQPDDTATRRVQLAPGVFVDVKRSLIESVGEPRLADLGLYEITENPADRWKFKTPTLRNVALTAPYMHDGSLATLEEVIEFYNQGGIANELLDPRIRPLHLDSGEKAALLALLRSLTANNIETLVADAFAAPSGDIRADDPRWTTPATPEKSP